MPELNLVDTQAAGGAVGRIRSPYLGLEQAGYGYGDLSGTGYMEYGTGTPGSLPFRVDSAGNVTAASINSVTAILPSGDTTGATDTAAIQAALNTAGPSTSVNGPQVVLGPGIFYLNATLNPTITGSSLVGSGWGTQIRYDGNVVSPAIGMADTTNRIFNIRWLRLSQINATAHGTAIEASYFQYSAIEHVLIDAGGAGVPPLIGISLNSNTTFYNVISDCKVQISGANSLGVRIDTLSNSNVLRNVRVLPDNTNASAIGVYVNSHAIYLDHVDIENAAGTGVSVGASGHGCTYIAPYLEANNINLALAAGVTGFIMQGGTCESGTTENVADAGAVQPQFRHVRDNILGVTYDDARDTPDWLPGDHGLLAWSFDPAMAAASGTLTEGVRQLIGMNIRRPGTISNLITHVAVAGGALTASQNYASLYNSAGSLLASSADMSATWNTTGTKVMPLGTVQAVNPGLYWVGLFSNGGTTPALAQATGVASTSTLVNQGVTVATARYAVNGTVTTLSNLTPANNSFATNAWWAGVS